jgi:hypothetical protein
VPLCVEKLADDVADTITGVASGQEPDDAAQVVAAGYHVGIQTLAADLWLSHVGQQRVAWTDASAVFSTWPRFDK